MKKFSRKASKKSSVIYQPRDVRVWDSTQERYVTISVNIPVGFKYKRSIKSKEVRKLESK